VSDVTRIFGAVESGDPNAAEELLPLVYEELRRLARHRMANERADHTLQATALVHEAWLRLAGEREQGWKNRAHFFAAAAEAMRWILVDRARQKQSARHGGGYTRVDLEMIDTPAKADEDVLLLVNEALEALAAENAKVAELVKLRFFTGMGVAEAALVLGVTDRTARNYWRFARAWLHDELETRK